jgi:hypothetical protein
VAVASGSDACGKDSDEDAAPVVVDGRGVVELGVDSGPGPVLSGRVSGEVEVFEWLGVRSIGGEAEVQPSKIRLGTTCQLPRNMRGM